MRKIMKKKKNTPIQKKFPQKGDKKKQSKNK